jgi:DNA-binding MarR family transcriptional regulator
MGAEETMQQERNLFKISDPCAALRRATRAITHLYDLVLAPTGLKSTQFILLQAIYERGEVAQWRLAEEYGLGGDTLSRRLAILRNDGLIAFRVGLEHPGEKLYRLTEAGLARYEQALPWWARAQERLLLVMGEERWEMLLKVSEEVVAEARHAEAARYANRPPKRAQAASAGPGADAGGSPSPAS